MSGASEPRGNGMDDAMSELNLKTKLFIDKLKEKSKGPESIRDG